MDYPYPNYKTKDPPAQAPRTPPPANENFSWYAGETQGVSEMSEDSEIRHGQQQQEARQKARDEAENDMKKAWNPEKKGDTDPSL
jgi:hypothetical protein